MLRNPSYIAWSALLLAVLAWAGVGFFISTILSASDSRTALSAQSQDSSSQASQSFALHALVSSSAQERGALATLVTVDPSTLADTIDAAGKAAGVSIQISDASSESAPSFGSVATQVFSFTASAQGSFATVMRAAELLETLPVPSAIQEIQIFETPNAPGVSGSSGAWQMNAQVRVLTASTVSS